MSTDPTALPTRETSLPAWLAIASGLAGLLSFACLLTYLFTPSLHMEESGAMPHAGRLLMNTNFLAAMLQAVLLLPVAFRFPGASRIASALGIAGFSLVALLRVLPIVTPAVSDILFMLPIGMVGIWLLLVNWQSTKLPPRAIRTLGIIAAVFLIGVALNFLFNGGLAVFIKGPFAYGNDIPFHIGLGLTGAPAFTLFPVWSILLGIRLLKPVPAP